MNAGNGGLDSQSGEASWLHGCFKLLSGFTFHLNKNHPVDQLQFLVVLIVTSLQLLSFPLSTNPSLPWAGTAVAPGATVLSISSGQYFVTQVTNSAYSVLVVISYVWMIAYSAIVALTATRASTDKNAAELLLPVARFTGGLAGTVLMLPIATFSASALGCPTHSSSATGGWMGSSNLGCTSAGAILLRIVMGILFVGYHLLLLFVVAVRVDRNPASRSWAAKSHGQVDAAMVLIKVALAVCFGVLQDLVLDSWLLPALLAVAALAWLGMVIRYLPFVHPGINAMQAGFASVFLWATVVLSLMRYTSTGDQSLLLYLGGALAYCGGFLACYMHEYFVAAQPLEDCERLVHLDVWARHRMQEFAAQVEARGSTIEQQRGKGTGRGRGPAYAVPRRLRPRYGAALQDSAGATQDDFRAQGEGVQRGGEAVRGSGDAALYLNTAAAAGPSEGDEGVQVVSESGGSSQAGGKGKRQGQGAGKGSRNDDGMSVAGSRFGGRDGGETVAYAGSVYPGSSAVGRSGAGRADAGGFHGFADENEDDDQATQALLAPEEDLSAIDQSTFFGWRLVNMEYATRRNREDEHHLYTAERAYRQMTAHFGQTAMAHVLAAEFYHQFCFENNFAEAQALSLARVRSPSLDLEAYIDGRTRGLREGADSHKLSAMDRVIFEQVSRQAQESRVSAMRSILKLWDHLSGHKLELSAIVHVGSEIEQNLSKTDELYRRMLRLNQGALVAREYAEFLMELMNDQQAAIELFNKADRLEERHTRQRAKAVRHVVLGSEAPAVDLLDDGAANLTLSVSDGSVGEILSASPSTCRVFGFANTSQIVGISFQTLLPEPVRSLYNRRLHQLQSSGFSDALNQTEVSFVLPSNGAILPVIVSMLESTPDEATSAPRLSVAIDVLRCDEHVIFFGGRGRGLKVISGSSRSLLLLGADSEQMQREPVMLPHFMPTADARGYRADHWDMSVMVAILRASEEAEGVGQDRRGDRRATWYLQQLQELLDGDSGGEGRGRVHFGDSSGEGGAETRKLASAGSFIGAVGKELLSGDSKDERGGAVAEDMAGAVLPQPTPHIGALRQQSSGGIVRSSLPRLPASLRPKPLLGVRETGIIPVENAADGTEFVLGSVQDVTPMTGHACFMLRWRTPSSIEKRAMQEQVIACLAAAGIAPPSGQESEIVDDRQDADGKTTAVHAARHSGGAHMPTGAAGRGRRTSFAARVGSHLQPGGGDSDSVQLAAGSAQSDESSQVPGPVVRRNSPGLAAGSLGLAVGSSGTDRSAHGGAPPQLELDGFHGPEQSFTLGPGGGAGGESVASGRSQLSTQLMRAVRSRGVAAKQEIASVKCTFASAMLSGLLGGSASMLVASIIGTLLTDVSSNTFLATDQALAFQTAETHFRTIAAVEFGAIPDPGPVATREIFDNFVAAVGRHEQRHSELLQATSVLNSDRAGDDATQRQYMLTEVSQAGTGSRTFNASLQEMGTYLSSVYLQLAESNDTARLTFGAPESDAISSNRDEYLGALNRSISLRQLDVVKSFEFSTTLFSVVCGVGFLGTVTVAAYSLHLSLSSIRDKTLRVARIVFLIPSRTAKKLQTKTMRKLTKLANQLDEVEEEDDEDERQDLIDEDIDELDVADTSLEMLQRHGAADRKTSPRKGGVATGTSAQGGRRARVRDESGGSIHDGAGQLQGVGTSKPPRMQQVPNMSPRSKRNGAVGASGKKKEFSADGQGSEKPHVRRRKSRSAQSARRLQKLKRGFSDSWSFTATHTAYFIVPVVLSFVWAIVEILLVVRMRQDVVRSNEQLVSSQRLAMDCVRIARIGGDYLYGGSNRTRNALADQLEVVEGRILQASSRIVLGATFVDEQTGLEISLGAVDDPVAKRLMVDDGCHEHPQYGECRNISSGVLRSGLRNTAISIVRWIRQARLGRPQPDLETGLSLTMLSQPASFFVPLSFVGDATSPYLRDGLELGSAIYSQNSKEIVDDTIRLVLITAPAMQFVVALGTIILYWSSPDRLAVPIRAGWQVIGVVPSSVMRHVPRMQESVKAELTRLQLGDSGAAGGYDDNQHESSTGRQQFYG